MKVYNFNKVNLIISSSSGQFYVTGFKEGTNIEAERESDKFTIHKSAKGDRVAFAATNDRSGTIQFTLMSDSNLCNKELQKLADAEEEFDAQIVDGNDTTKSNVTATTCVIKKPAKYDRGQEITDSQWVIWAGIMEMDYD